MGGSRVCQDGEKFDKVFTDELGYARERWQVVYGDNVGGRTADHVKPTTQNELVGLACSGGGIRSATINLGIAQALHERGVFDHVDYLSTVSGGGYLGSSISTAMRWLPSDEEKPDYAVGKGEFPYAVDFGAFSPSGGAEPQAAESSPFLTWVRNNSNYMATGGFLDFARIGGVLIRGILVNFLVLLPILLLLAVGLFFRYEGKLTSWNADRTWNVAVDAEGAARAAEDEAKKTARGGGAAAHTTREAAETARRHAVERWKKAQADAARAATIAPTRVKQEQFQKRAQRAATLSKKPAAGPRAEIAKRDLLRASSFFTLAPIFAGVFVFLALVFPVFIRVYKVYKHGAVLKTGEESDIGGRSQVEMAFAWSLVAIGGFALIEAMPILIHGFHQLRDVGWRGAFAGVASGGALAAISASGNLLSKLSGLKQKLILIGVGLLGLVIPLVVMLYVTEELIYAEWGALEPFALLAPFAGLGKGALWLAPGILLVLLGGGAGGSIVGRVVKPSKIRPFLSAVAVLVGAVFGYWLIGALSGLLARVAGPPGEVLPWVYVVFVGAAIVLFCWAAVDVNLTGVLGLYRDRLASAYLIGLRKKKDSEGRATGEEEIFIEPDLNLEDICGGTPHKPGKAMEYRSKAPYHIVNTALNLQGSSDQMLRDRNSDFVMFSKYYYGGDRVGFCKTRHLEQVFPQMDLPTAMAISAAAASPNSGRVTNKPLVALMTLLNVRLGYWVPHPGRLCSWLNKMNLATPQLQHRWGWRIRPWALLREMVSAVDEEHKWINLSDGGHIENLATYELLRRRCKYIIIGDGEGDPELNFGGLANLMRFARIDMGIEIEILLDDLRLDDRGLSHQHAALGKIQYPPCDGVGAEEGYLLYIKSSVTGDEDETIHEYRAENADFPQQSTADQFFDEGQFEGYRALGYHLADGLFPPRRDDGTLPRFGRWEEFTGWFDKLRADLAPRLSAKHTELQDQLREIQKLLKQPAYHDYFYELHPQLSGAKADRSGSEGPTQLPEIMYLVHRQLALMENAFVNLNLDQPQNWNHEGNQGWRTLFRGWSKSETFREGYRHAIDLYSGRFQNFCEIYLDMPAAAQELEAAAG